MDEGLAKFLRRIGEQYADAAIIIQKSSFIRPCEVLNLTSGDVKIPGSIVLEGEKSRVETVVIRNAKTAKNGKPQFP